MWEAEKLTPFLQQHRVHVRIVRALTPHSHFTLFCTTICNLLGRHSCSISTFCLAICSTLLLAFRGDSWVIDEQETLGVARALAGRYEQDYKSLDNRLSTFLCWLQIGSELSMFPCTLLHHLPALLLPGQWIMDRLQVIWWWSSMFLF